MIEVTFKLDQHHDAAQSTLIINNIKTAFASNPNFVSDSIEIVELKNVPANDEEAQREFWLGIIMKDGNVDVEQTLKELSDFSFMIHEVPKVYMHVTGGLLSKPLYHAYGVTDAADEYYRKHYAKEFSDLINDMKSTGEINENAAKNILEKIKSDL